MPDPILMIHPVGDVQLSAYYDDALDENERRVVAEHVARCPRCRARLAEFVYLSAILHADADPFPPRSLDMRVEALLAEEARRWLPRLIPNLPPPARSGVVAAALVAVLVIALFYGQVVGGGPVGPTVAQAYPCTDSSQCAIAVHFNAPVDRAAVERTVQVDPPVRVNLAWQGDTLLVKPSQPLKPSQPYTVSLGVVPSASGATHPGAAKVTVKVVPRALGSPVVVTPVSPVVDVAARDRNAAPSSPTPTPRTPTATAEPDSPTPVPPSPTSAPVLAPRAPTATPTAPPPKTSPTPTPCPTLPTGLISPGQGSLERLGCATGPATSVELAAQTFAQGRLIWLADRHQIVAFVASGGWTSYPDGEMARAGSPGVQGRVPAANAPRILAKFLADNPTARAALGSPLSPAADGVGTVEEFQHGSLIWAAPRTVIAQYSGGTWGTVSDVASPSGPTATPTPTPVSAETATATPKPSPSPSPTGTPPTPTPTETEAARTPTVPSTTPSPTASLPSPTTSPPTPSPTGRPATSTPILTQTPTASPTATATVAPAAAVTDAPTTSTPTATEVALSTPAPTGTVCPSTPASTATAAASPPLADPTHTECGPSPDAAS